MEGIFLTLYRFFKSRRFLFFSILLAIFFIALYLASRLSLEEDISRSVTGDQDQVATILNRSRLTNKVIIHLWLTDTTSEAQPDTLTSFADELVDSLKAADMAPYINTKHFRVNDTMVDQVMDLFYNHLPVFLTPSDYDRIDSMLTPDRVNRSLKRVYDNLISPTGFAVRKYVMRDPLGITSLALSRLRQFQLEEGYEVIDGYIFANRQKDLLLFLDPANPPSETGKNTMFFKQLDHLFSKLEGERQHRVSAEYYGAAAVAVGNAEQIKKDIALTVTLAMVLILLFVGWFFRKKGIPFIAFLPAVFGGLVALALIFLFRGHLSTIALGIGSVLLGIIVDYALYFYSLYMAKGSVEPVIRDMSLSIAICSITSAIAFFSLLFVQSEVLRDLGLFAGLSILGAAFFSLTVLPHLVSMKPQEKTGRKVNPIVRWVSYPFESSRFLWLLVLLLTFVFYLFRHKVGFEKDMYAINYESSRLKQAEKNLNRISDLSLRTVYVVSLGQDLEHALALNNTLLNRLDSMRETGMIPKYSNPGSILIPESLQQERINRWNRYWSDGKRKKIEDRVAHESEKFGFNRDAFTPFFQWLDMHYGIVDPGDFKPVRDLFLNDLITETPDMTMVISLIRVTPERRHQVYTMLAGRRNPVIIDRLEMTSDFVHRIRKDFDLLVKLCLILVTFTLIFTFGRIETGLIASAPMFVSWLWTLGFMGIFDIRFNIINIIVTTFVFGLGVDYSVLMMRGFLLEYKTGQRDMISYKTSIFLSAFTTLIGVGVLILARHPALHSIALISIVGMLSVVVISYTVEPVLFNWLIKKKGDYRKLPVTLTDLVTTLIVFSIFVAGSLMLNLLLLVVMLLPVAYRHKKYFMHQAMAFSCKIPIYAMVHIRKKIINLRDEDFSKPALIISNHQSHIDLLLLLMLHPKIMVVTTRWVWNNPIYALVIRFLGFFPVMEGYPSLVEKLRPAVSAGYSVLVFPEGSRSPDARITRFHKGAFLLAGELNLDILPIFIHGASDCMTKGENHLRRGSVTLKIYPRIKTDDPSFGPDYHFRTKAIQNWYRKEWRKIREELETPDYFRYKLIRNYLYKGPVLEWYTRIKLKLEKNYRLYNRYVPRSARIVDVGCGYGFLAYMLSFVSEQRQITGIDYDGAKIELASHCISKHDRIHFIAADVSDYNFDFADVFILGDVLHYMPEEEQEITLIRCFNRLNPGGVILIRDADRDLHKRHWGTRYTEFFSTRTGFNKSDRHRLYFFSGEKIRQMAAKHNMNLEIIDNTRMTSNILYVMKKVNI